MIHNKRNRTEERLNIFIETKQKLIYFETEKKAVKNGVIQCSLRACQNENLHQKKKKEKKKEKKASQTSPSLPVCMQLRHR